MSLVSAKFSIPCWGVSNIKMEEDKSILDADLVLINPEFAYSRTVIRNGIYQRQPLYGIKNLIRDVHRWKQDITLCLQEGVNVFLMPEVYVEYVPDPDTIIEDDAPAINTFSIVEDYLPQKVIPRAGGQVVFGGHQAFRKFNETYGEQLKYGFYLDSSEKSLYSTKVASRRVGHLWPCENAYLVLLPWLDLKGFISFYSEFETFESAEDQSEYWDSAYKHFAQTLLDVSSNLSRHKKKLGLVQSPPVWARDKPTLVNISTSALESEIAELDRQLAGLSETRDIKQRYVRSVKTLDRLLYATGDELEDAVSFALEILGFQTESRVIDGVEIDHVISLNGTVTFIGETEGRESAAIAKEKVLQLANAVNAFVLDSDLENAPKGILFGNAQRLSPLAERGEWFTQDCLKNAIRTHCLLVRTCDLFEAVKYVLESSDKSYVEQIRNVFYEGEGLLSFPATPHQATSSDAEVVANT